VPEAAIVHADSELLARVFQNLLANAIDHAPGGEISVGAEMSAESDAVVCWVRDDGVGIASQQIERVFDKGATTRGARRARGFGLQIVEQLIEAHGGRVAVESAEGFGATFWFELPGLSRGSRTGC
jgi:signal transduction histidine kinase